MKSSKVILHNLYKQFDSVLKSSFLFVIGIYRTCISPLFPPSCRYHPSCSAYAKEALQTRGVFSALFLSLKRVLRCHPFSKGGFDPVPPSSNEAWS